jgi:hypothetical protein
MYLILWQFSVHLVSGCLQSSHTDAPSSPVSAWPHFQSDMTSHNSTSFPYKCDPQVAEKFRFDATKCGSLDVSQAMDLHGLLQE